jgi:PAS domain-containing protein
MARAVYDDGEEAYFTVALSAVRDDAGEIVAFFNPASETTGRVLAERRLEAARRALEVERSRLAAVFEQSPSFLAVLRGPDKVFEFVNPAYQPIVGQGRALVGRPLFEALPEARGQRFDEFLAQRIFTPLGMTDTTFYPTAEQQKRIARSYRLENDELVPAEILIFAGRELSAHDRVPLANGGLFTTAQDYGRFARMLLNDGSLDGTRILKPDTVKVMSSVQSGDLKTGFTPGDAWGLGVCLVRTPQGVTEALSPGCFGHGGAYGTQAWIDPVKKVAYVLMVQRANFPNSDASDVRRAFQNAAAKALSE